MSFMEGKGQWKGIDHGSKKTEGQVVGSKSINVHMRRMKCFCSLNHSLAVNLQFIEAAI